MKKGKSASAENPMGARRMARDEKGTMRTLAPRRFRKMGRRYMEDVTDAEIAVTYCGIDNFAAQVAALVKQAQVAKGQVTRIQKKIDALKAVDKDADTGALESDMDGWKRNIADEDGKIAALSAKVAAFRAS
jgi:hypothetical protein